MTRPAFTIRPSEKTSRTIEELAELMGVTKNKLISGILEESQEQMQEMVEQLTAAKRSINGFATLQQIFKKTVSESSKKNDDFIDKMTKGKKKR